MIKSARRHPKRTAKVTETVQAPHVRRAHPPHIRHRQGRITTRRGTEGRVEREVDRKNMEKTTTVVKGRGPQVAPSHEEAANGVPVVARVGEGPRVKGPTLGVLQYPVGILVQEVLSFIPPRELWS